MNELVSVVITTYKRSVKYVKEAIDSVASQTYHPIEIILVDDNGINSEYANELTELCNKYENVRYLPNVKNSGAQVSRNNGIFASKGNFVAFLDDDDIWREDKIEKQMAYFSDKDVGMVYCDGYSFEDGNINNTSVFREASIYSKPISHELELFNDYIGSTSQALIKKECFSKVGLFDTDMPARQDYEMWLRISRHYKIVGSPEKLLFYRVHPGDRISTNLDKCFNSYKLVLDKHKNEYNKNRYAKSKIILRLFDTSVRGKWFGRALFYFTYAFLVNPLCVIDVIRRRILKKEFEDYYSIELIESRLKL